MSAQLTYSWYPFDMSDPDFQQKMRELRLDVQHEQKRQELEGILSKHSQAVMQISEVTGITGAYLPNTTDQCVFIGVDPERFSGFTLPDEFRSLFHPFPVIVAEHPYMRQV